MSSSCSIRWIEQLLFGTPSILTSPPAELKNIIFRMEAENIPWSHIMLQGGLTAFPYQVRGDLSSLTEHLERQWIEEEPPRDPQPFKTRAVERFWHDLQSLLVQREEVTHDTSLPPSEEDDAILKDMLEGSSRGPYSYQSAAFWGEVARRFIHLRRPETVSALPDVSDDHSKKILQLYDVTSKARGQYLNPLSFHLVHYKEHVHAAHWKSPQNLIHFMLDRPSHTLTRSIQTLLKNTVESVLHGEKPSALLDPCPRLDALLHNIRVVHESVEQVTTENTPPKLIDIFQRLLALSYKDNLWEKEIPVLPIPYPFLGTSLFYLTEQVRILESEKRLLWKQITAGGEESSPGRPERTCSNYLYAKSKPLALHGGERAHRNIPR